MPPLLSDVVPNEVPIFVPRLLAEQPHLAAIVAETVSTWAYAEHSLGKTVAAMSRGTSTEAMRDYADRWRFSDRKKIIIKLAKTKLSTPYLETFLKTVDMIASLAKRRHAFAHGIWGAVEALPGCLLLVDPEHIFMHWGVANDWLARFVSNAGPLGRTKPLDNKLVEVWSMADLRAEATSMHEACQFAGALEAIASDDPFDPSNTRRKQVHSWLLAQSMIGA